MKTICYRLTRGDHMTQPGGVILRQKDDGEFVTHCFNRRPGTKEPTEFYWGHYLHDRYLAECDYEGRVDRQSRYETGGSLIPIEDEDTELESERIRARLVEYDRDGFTALDPADPATLHGVLGAIMGDD